MRTPKTSNRGILFYHCTRVTCFIWKTFCSWCQWKLDVNPWTWDHELVVLPLNYHHMPLYEDLLPHHFFLVPSGTCTCIWSWVHCSLTALSPLYFTAVKRLITLSTGQRLKASEQLTSDQKSYSLPSVWGCKMTTERAVSFSSLTWFWITSDFVLEPTLYSIQFVVV